jgi:hypothetical protein
MHRLLSAATLSCAVGVSGCVINITDEDGYYGHRSARAEEQHNRDSISQLQLGTTVEHVRAQLGEPAFSEAWLDGNEEVRVLRYRTHRTKSDGDTTVDETTPLVFRAGRLVGIGERLAAGG